MKKPGLRLSGLLGIATILLLSTCKKDDGLPPETQEGANAFGCKVNGKAWIPNGGPGFMGAKPIEGGFKAIYDNSNRRSVGVHLSTYKLNGEMIDLHCNNYEIGQYKLNQETNVRPFVFNPKDYGMFSSADGNYYVTNTTSYGTLTITKSDTVTGLLSGTFEFKAKDKKSGKVVEISNGRFDINVLTIR
ncbi:MAG: DUF6252 family protein [Cytophagaceae bacterium]|nr:DUF6252 family protein [Cytophagaceae bacterium]